MCARIDVCMSISMYDNHKPEYPEHHVTLHLRCFHFVRVEADTRGPGKQLPKRATTQNHSTKHTHFILSRATSCAANPVEKDWKDPRWGFLFAQYYPRPSLSPRFQQKSPQHF